MIKGKKFRNLNNKLFNLQEIKPAGEPVAAVLPAQPAEVPEKAKELVIQDEVKPEEKTSLGAVKPVEEEAKAEALPKPEEVKESQETKPESLEASSKSNSSPSSGSSD